MSTYPNDTDNTPIPASLPPPGIFAALGAGWQQMMSHFLPFFLGVLVLSVVYLPNSINDTAGNSPFYSLVLMAYTLLFIPVIKYGCDQLFLSGVRGERIDIKVLAKGFSLYLNVVLSSLLVIALILMGLVVFILPGIYVACRLAFVSYLVIDEGLDPIQAVEASWRLTRGHVLKILGLGIIAAILFTLGLLLMLVGAYAATIWMKAAFASLYLSISQPGAAEAAA